MSEYLLSQVLNKELETHQAKVDELQLRLDTLGKQFKSTEAVALGKDVAVLKKKFDAAHQKADKVVNILISAVVFNFS